MVLSNTWEDNKDKKFYFPIVVKNDNYDCQRIHPLKQRIVDEVYNYIKDNVMIEKVIIFGSAINVRCNNKSDVDIAIKVKEEYFNKESKNNISEDIQEICDYNSDIIWLNTIDEKSQLYYNINTKGVVIYE